MNVLSSTYHGFSKDLELKTFLTFTNCDDFVGFNLICILLLKSNDSNDIGVKIA
jgi:hypothetical protein